ncbi:MAG TPA: hypothetical protein VGI96_33220 [Streptosporangiaceae bacterium]|jgi:hypothetical protein
MAPVFDAVGPSSAGAHSGSATSLTWAHTITGASTVLAAMIAVDTGTDTSVTTTATYNGAAMTSLGKVHSGAAAAGYLEVFGIVAAANAGANVVVTSNTSVVLTGGSLSFTGASQTVGTAFGTPATANLPQNSAPTAALAGNTSGNIIAGFVANGASITSATAPSTSRFINNGGGGNAAGCGAAATSPATGSSVTMAWATTTDWFAELLVEVLPPPGFTAAAATGAGAALNAGIVTSNVTVGPEYATAASDLGGGSGSWATPQYAEGGP